MNDLAINGLLIVAAYLLGSIPFGYLSVRLLGRRDIRTVGSRNVGTLNTWHQVGTAGAAPVLVLDAAKGALAALFPGWLGAPEWVVYCTATMAILGHNWPVFLKFHGGKGVAPLLGIALALFPMTMLVALAPAVLFIILTRNAIIGIVVGMAVFPVLNLIRGGDLGLTLFLVGLTGFVVACYVYGARGQMWEAVKTRRLRGVFYGSGSDA